MKQEYKNTMWIMVARQKPPPPPIRQQTVNNPPPPRRSQAESKAMNMKIKQVRFSTHQVRNSLIHQSLDFTAVYFSFQENLNFFMIFLLIFQIFQNWLVLCEIQKIHYFLLLLIIRKFFMYIRNYLGRISTLGEIYQCQSYLPRLDHDCF